MTKTAVFFSPRNTRILETTTKIPAQSELGAQQVRMTYKILYNWVV